MRIAYLTQFHHLSAGGATISVQKTAEDMAQRGHRILVIAASDREYSYNIYRNNITIVQLRSFKCPLFIGKQPMFLPFPTILQSLYRFRPDIIYMDKANSMNWIGHAYSFFSHIPIKPTPQLQI